MHITSKEVYCILLVTNTCHKLKGAKQSDDISDTLRDETI